MKRVAPSLAIVALLGFARIVHAMAEEKIGPDTPERPTIAQPGWPKGIEQPLRHPSRVYSIWVNGNENFYFNAKPDEINELVEQFSKARLRDHQVKLEFGRPKITSFKKQEFEYNVSLSVLSGIALFMNRERGDDQTLEPVMTIYLDADGALLKQLKVPENVIVTSSAELPEIKAKRTLPARKAYFGRVEFDDGDPTGGIERGISTHITLWQKELPEGIELAQVNRDGLFKLVLSEGEIASITKGEQWITITTGNYLTAARADHAKYDVAKLAQDKQNAQAVKVPAPKYYYGRILFEDGAPPFLDPKPWPGAEINVNFSFAGSAKPDNEGYFQVYFDPDQYEKLSKDKPRKNIYIPDKETGHSSAKETFPVQLLSQDKDKAGVVKIRRPVYGPGV